VEGGGRAGGEARLREEREGGREGGRDRAMVKKQTFFIHLKFTLISPPSFLPPSLPAAGRFLRAANRTAHRTVVLYSPSFAPRVILTSSSPYWD